MVGQNFANSKMLKSYGFEYHLILRKISWKWSNIFYSHVIVVVDVYSGFVMDDNPKCFPMALNTILFLWKFHENGAISFISTKRKKYHEKIMEQSCSSLYLLGSPVISFQFCHLIAALTFVGNVLGYRGLPFSFVRGSMLCNNSCRIPPAFPLKTPNTHFKFIL